MDDAILEQVRAHLGIVEALSSWSAEPIWDVLIPSAVCHSNAEDNENMPTAQRLLCPLQFGSVGLAILLDSSANSDGYSIEHRLAA